MTGALLIPEWEIRCLKANGSPGHFSRLLCFNSLTWLMLRPPCALIHHSSGSELKSILADLHIKLVVRVVFHVETKGPALQPLLLITETIHLCWVHQDEKWHFVNVHDTAVWPKYTNVTKSKNWTSVTSNLPTTTLYSHFHLYKSIRMQVWMW